MKKFIIPCIFLFLSILLFSTSALVGSYLDSSGMLIEPAFFCVPLGYLTLGLAFFTALYSFVKQRLLKKYSAWFARKSSVEEKLVFSTTNLRVLRMDVDVDIKRLHKHSFYSSITNNYSQSPKEAFFGITFSIFSPAGYIVFCNTDSPLQSFSICEKNQF